MSGLNEWMYTLLLLMAFEAVTVTTQEQGKHPAYNDILRTFKRHGTSYIL